jgi:rubrerythrin
MTRKNVVGNGLAVVMDEWIKEVKRLEKQARCRHRNILRGADGKTGICEVCGYTVKIKKGMVVE